MNSRSAPLVLLTAYTWLLPACTDSETASGPEADASPPELRQDAAEDAPLDPACAFEADGVEVMATDLEGYPPYAVDGCRLLYVSSTASPHGGALVMRELHSGTESVMSPAEASPRKPTLSGEIAAWEETVEGLTHVHVRLGDRTVRLEGDFDHSGEPKAISDAVVFTGFLTTDDEGDSDVFLFDARLESVTLIAGGPGQQRFADLSETHIAISDFSEDASGFYDENGVADADVILYERLTGSTHVRARAGKQAYPMLGAKGALAYLEWVGPHRPVPKLAGYTIRAVPLESWNAEGAFIATVNNDSPGILPSAFGTSIEWVETTGDTSTLRRTRIDGAIEPRIADGLGTLDLHAPASTDGFTILASEALEQSATLRAVPRPLDL